MFRSRITRTIALGTGAVATGALVFALAPAATAQSDADPAADAPVSAPGHPGRMSDAPYVGARLVPTKDGATVSHVIDQSPADVAGLDEGDIVLSIGGVDLDTNGSLREALSGTAPGDELTVVFTHDGVEQSVIVTVGSPEDRPAPPAAEDVPWVGAHLVRAENTAGVVVRSVVADGPADAAGIKAGDVVTAIDGEAVTDWWQAREMLRDNAPADEIKVAIDRDGKALTVTVTLGSAADAGARPLDGARPHEGAGTGDRPARPDVAGN